MSHSRPRQTTVLMALALAVAAGQARAQVNPQCPPGAPLPDGSVPGFPNVKCRHLTAGDGFIKMADGKHQYMFGFHDVTGVPPNQVIAEGLLAANFPAPTIAVDEGDQFYLSLTNVGMMIRPDLFDPHSVHFHGFPQAATIFDGVPEASVAVRQGSTFTYYYNLIEPGTYMYHCHVEATEHMQMGMLGNLYVRPAQNSSPTPIGGYSQFAYNDGDGTTGYDVDYPIQIGSFDPDFHDASEAVQPLPFALMKDRYPMLNGRGYPDTLVEGALDLPDETGGREWAAGTGPQPVSSLITATPGQRVLLRLSNLNVTRFYTLATLGVSMKVVGWNARLLRGPDGKDLYYSTNSVTLGGGEAADVLIDIPTLAVPGTTYFLYTTNLNHLSNDKEDFGGMMTEIRVGSGS